MSQQYSAMGPHILPRTNIGGNRSSGAEIFRRQQLKASPSLARELLFPQAMPPLLVLLLLLLTVLTSTPLSAARSYYVPVSQSGCSRTTTIGNKTVTHKLCVSLGAGFTLAWTLSGEGNTTLNATFVAYPTDAYGWVSFGFSPNCEMVGSTAFIAYGTFEDTTMIAVKPFYLVNKEDDGTAVAVANATFVVNGSPVVEFTNAGMNATVHFSVQLDSPGTQCVVFANGDPFSISDFNAKPVPWFLSHSRDGGKYSQLDFTTGTEGASPPPPPSAPSLASTPAATLSPPPPPPKAASPMSRAHEVITAATLLALMLFPLVATLAC